MQANTRLLGNLPVLGFGTWEMTGSQCTQGVEDAITLGYRHVDTAQIYENEKEVGLGIKNSTESRENIFITTKIATSNLTPSRIENSTYESLKKLGTDYVDLLLIHWPTEEMDLKACLDTMFGLKESNHVRQVGVSNFGPELFQEAIKTGPVLNNQVKFSPRHGEFENLAVAKARGKIITAYSPLEKGNVKNIDLLKEIGKTHGKTASQVALRWLIQLGNVSVIPKAQSHEHRKENIEIFDFELSGEDMDEIIELSITAISKH